MDPKEVVQEVKKEAVTVSAVRPSGLPEHGNSALLAVESLESSTGALNY